jgi:peptide/nickel transport system ATP-binding protein
MRDDLLVARGVGVVDQHRNVLVEDASIALRPGDILPVMGESGSGKSLFAAALLGTLPPSLSARGELSICGVTVTLGDRAAAPQQRAWWGRSLALLPQEPWTALDPTMPVGAHVNSVWRHVRGLAPAEAQQRAVASLADVGLAGTERRYPHALSGGMAQRVTVAATMATGASIVIADEPTKGLDAHWRDEVVALLAGIAAAGSAVLVITHDLAVARALGGRLAVMKAASIIEYGETARVLAHPAEAYTRQLIAADPTTWPSAAPAAVGAPVLTCDALTVARGNRTLFRDVNFTIAEGEWQAVVGPSGVGKTSLGDALLGLIEPLSGTIRQRVAHPRPHPLQKLYQDPIAAFAPHVPLTRILQHVAKRFGVEHRRIALLCERLRLRENLLRRRAAEVSGGELQRIALLRLALIQPHFVFADEPSSRLDLILQAELFTLMRDVFSASAVLLVTHDRDIARAMAATHVSLTAPS